MKSNSLHHTDCFKNIAEKYAKASYLIFNVCIWIFRVWCEIPFPFSIGANISGSLWFRRGLVPIGLGLFLFDLFSFALDSLPNSGF